jgi:hypothetical protein
MTRPPHPLVLVTGTSAFGVAKVRETSDLVGPPRVITTGERSGKTFRAEY